MFGLELLWNGVSHAFIPCHFLTHFVFLFLSLSCLFYAKISPGLLYDMSHALLDLDWV